MIMTTTTETAYTTTTIRGAIKNGHVEKDILVVNTDSRDAPFLLDKSGQKIPQFDFKEHSNKRKIYAETSIIFKGEFWVFGGTTGHAGISTISKVINCEVKEVGQMKLPFNYRVKDFPEGRGTVRNDETIYLCFDWWENQSCIKSNDPLGRFTNIKSNTQFVHRRAAMASSNGKFKSIIYKTGLKFIKFKIFSADKLFR